MSTHFLHGSSNFDSISLIDHVPKTLSLLLFPSSTGCINIQIYSY